MSRHPVWPHLLARGLQPQIACFVPGNAGEAYLREPPLPPGNVARWFELRCDGLVIEASAPSYEWNAERGDEYWQRLESALNSAALAGMMVDFRVTTGCVARLHAGGEDQERRFTERLVALAARSQCVIISFDCAWNDPPAARLRALLRTAAPGLLFGQRLTDLSDLCADADFVVVRPASAPAGYRDQAAVGYWHRRFAGRPVIFELDTPDPKAGLFWFAAGAAGLQHKSFPPSPDPENHRLFVALRALSVLLMNLPDGRCPIRPEWAGDGISLAFGTPGDFCGYLLEPRATPEIMMTSPENRPDIIAFWFSMARNQSIIEPRQIGPVQHRRTLSQPSNDGWFWGYYALPRPDNGGSTVTEGRDIPPGPFM
ncbi:MAG: hypothetical protein N2111_05490 [Candidatus Sumerlaeaceae bacterium]|nr:hypothetical protein [Candidatus Sumerlaeaceae bacterium]